MNDGITKWRENKVTEIGTRQWKFEHLAFENFSDGLPRFNNNYTVCLSSKCTDFPMDELEM
jgi:hypothetical protein